MNFFVFEKIHKNDVTKKHFNTYSFRIMTQRGVAKFDFFEIFYTQGPFGWKGWGTIFLLP